MVTDYLPGRAYRRRARYWLGHVPVTIEWFPAHRFAEQLPVPRLMGSNQWLPNHSVIEGLGEVDEPRQFVLEAFQPYSGETFCGRPEWFSEGIPEDAAAGLAPCPRCIIPSGEFKIKVRVPSSIKGNVEIDIGITSQIAPESRSVVKVPVASAVSSSARVKVPVAGLVATGSYSTAFSSAWDSYRFV